MAGLRGDQKFFVGALVVAMAALVWVEWQIIDPGSGSEPVAAQGAAPAGEDEPGVSHVHGLGLNPADGSLHVATHHGTFRLAEGGDEPERVGGSYQDTMGFTVTGPDEFLGSGHPDFAGIKAGQPKHLGLIESTDGGETWETVSLLGEVDFHGLVAAHGHIYGWDSTSGRFMVSPNRRTWFTRSVRDLLAFAVDPQDEDHIVAAAPEGLLESTDGGRTWNALEGPKLTVLSWEDGASLIGADQEGEVSTSGDGREWTSLPALPGEPQAIVGAPLGAYAAVFDDMDTTALYRLEVGPDDEPTGWELLYRES